MRSSVITTLCPYILVAQNIFHKRPPIKYVTLFLANFDTPTPCHTLSHIPGHPPESTPHISEPPLPIFSMPSTKKPGQKPLVQILSQLFAGVFVREVLPEGFLSGKFCLGWFLSIALSVRIRVTTKS